MTLTDAEQRFMARQGRGHLATVGLDGVPAARDIGAGRSGEVA